MILRQMKLSGVRLTRRIEGFTLIEMVVSLALVSLICVAMIESLRFAQRTYRQVTVSDAKQRDMFVAQRLIRRTMEQAYPTGQTANSGNAGFEGSVDRVRYLAPSPLAHHASGLFYYEISVENSATQGRSSTVRSLVIAWWPDTSLSGGRPAEPETETLLEDIAGLEIAYYPAPQFGGIHHSADRSAEANWLHEWRSSGSLPHLIRIRVQYSKGDPRQWQDLLVAPKITHGALCHFDAIAQDCRLTT